MKANTSSTRLFVTIGTSAITNMLRYKKELLAQEDYCDLQAAWEAVINNSATPAQISLLKKQAADFLLHDHADFSPTDVHNGSHNELLLAPAASHTKTYPKASAEIQSINAIIFSEQWKENTRFDLFLISTDTLACKLSAKLVQLFFQQYPHKIGNIHIQNIDGLQVDNQKQLTENGFQQLVNYFLQTDQNTPGIINVTGGYKGIIPILSTIGQLLDMPIAYNYELNSELILINPLPIGFDWTHMELYRFFLSDLETKTICLPDGTKSQMKVFDLAKIEGSALHTFFRSEMVERGFMTAADAQYYRKTYLGDLLNRYIEKVYPLAAQNFGIPLELLLFECLSREPLCLHTHTYDKMLFRQKYSTPDGGDCEIDFVLSSTTSSRQLVVEMTSFGQLFTRNNYLYEFRSQLKRQCTFFKTNRLSVDTYVLVLYGFKIGTNWNIVDKGIQLVWKELQKANINDFVIYTMDLPIAQSAVSNNRNVYSAIFQKKITFQTELWQSGLDDKYGNPYLLLRKHLHLPNRKTTNHA